MRRPAPTERGIALLAVLWVATLLSLLSMMTIHRSSSDLRLAQNLVDNAEAELAANSAARLAAAGIVSGALPWPPESEPQVLTVAGSDVLLRIEDEMARIDLNAAEPGLIAALLVELGASEIEGARLAAAIADYRDPDSLRRHGGAEDDDYAAAGRPLGANDSWFADPAELMRVLGMPTALDHAVAPYLTTLTGRTEPDLTSSAEPVRRAVARYTGAEALGPLPSSEPQVPAGRALVLPRVRSGDGPSGTMVRVTAEARMPSGARFVREAIFSLTSGEDPVRVELWRRGRPLPEGER